MCRRIAEIVKNRATLTLVTMGTILMFASVGLLIYFFLTVSIHELPPVWVIALSSCIIIYIIGFFLGLSFVVYICTNVEIVYESVDKPKETSVPSQNAPALGPSQIESRHLNIHNSTVEEAGCSIPMGALNSENSSARQGGTLSTNCESRVVQDLRSYVNIVSHIQPAIV